MYLISSCYTIRCPSILLGQDWVAQGTASWLLPVSQLPWGRFSCESGSMQLLSLENCPVPQVFEQELQLPQGDQTETSSSKIVANL